MADTLTIVLDGISLAQTATSLAHALEIVCASFTDDDQIITGAMLDGMQLTSAHLTEPDETKISGTLSLTTGSARAILADAIRAGLGEIEQLKESHARSADQIAAGDTHGAILGLKHIVTTWQQIEQLISFAASRFGNTSVQRDNSIVQTLAGLGNDLRELARSISEEDSSALADCLMFDLQGRADECAAWLASVGNELATTTS